MSFKRLSIITVLFLVALLLASRVLAAVVASITIQDQNIDLSNSYAPINITLSGDPATPQTFSIPITITYNDGSTRNLGFVFNYQPPPASAPQQTCPYQEDPQNCSYGGTRSCTGTWQDEVCKYDGGVDPNCFETCNPAPASRGCYSSEDFSQYDRCGGCGEEIWACWDEDGKHEKRFYGGDTDTQATVAGAFAGACYGIDAIPVRWKDKLNPFSAEAIAQKAEKLYHLSK